MELLNSGIAAPRVFYYDPDEGVLIEEFVEGIRLKEALEEGKNEDKRRILFSLGKALGRMHSSGLSHGDLTTSNIVITPRGLTFIDPSFGSKEATLEDMGTDLNLFTEAHRAAHPGDEELLEIFFDGYREGCPFADEVIRKAEEIERRARYLREEV